MQQYQWRSLHGRNLLSASRRPHQLCKKTEHSRPRPVQPIMKRLLGLFLALLSVTPPSLQGLLLSTIPDFWIHPPPHQPPRIRPPRPVPPAPTYPIEVSYTKIDKIKDQIATTTSTRNFTIPTPANSKAPSCFPCPKVRTSTNSPWKSTANRLRPNCFRRTRPAGYTRTSCAGSGPGPAGVRRTRLVQGPHLPDRTAQPQTHHAVIFAVAQIRFRPRQLHRPFNTEKFCARPIKNVSSGSTWKRSSR